MRLTEKEGGKGGREGGRAVLATTHQHVADGCVGEDGVGFQAFQCLLLRWLAWSQCFSRMLDEFWPFSVVLAYM